MQCTILRAVVQRHSGQRSGLLLGNGLSEFVELIREPLDAVLALPSSLGPLMVPCGLKRDQLLLLLRYQLLGIIDS